MIADKKIELREDLPPLPKRMQSNALDHRGFPIPYFVAYVDGKPDFRIIDPDKMAKCFVHKKCWLCGDKMGRYMTFVVGPMCVINRTSGEPPCHKDCAVFAAEACPFLIRPNMRRNEKDIPEGCFENEMHIRRNPAATALYTTKSYKSFRAGEGVLFEMGEPENVIWYAEGKIATRQQVQDSIDVGLPALQEVAQKEGELPALERYVQRAMRLLPDE